MVNFNFDNVERRAYQEPQTTKRELLRPPPQSANSLSNGDWHTPSGPAGISDFLADQATWTFNDIDKHAVAPAKVETVLPMVRSEKRQRDEEPVYGPSTKKQSKDKKDESSRAAEDKDGEMDVIDLTSDVEDNNEQTIFPERQFVPRAHDDSRTTQRRKSPSPPRTFIRGFSPIAAHPRKPPIVNKSKPPIKPPDRRQRRTTQSSTSSSHQVFRGRASMSSTRSEPRPGTPIARSTPTVTLDSRSPKGPSTTGISTCGPPRKSGPFLQEEDSDSEGEAGPEDRQVTRGSVEDLVNRPKHDTPARLELARLQGASQDMRAAARDKTHKGLITPATSEKNPDGADRTDAAASDPKPSKSFLGLPHQRLAM